MFAAVAVSLAALFAVNETNDAQAHAHVVQLLRRLLLDEHAVNEDGWFLRWRIGPTGGAQFFGAQRQALKQLCGVRSRTAELEVERKLDQMLRAAGVQRNRKIQRMDGRNLELNRAAQEVIGQRQRGPEHRGLPNLDRVLGKAIEHIGVQSHARLFGQAYDLVSFLAALVLKLYQLKGRAHARQNCGTRLDAGQRL